MKHNLILYFILSILVIITACDFKNDDGNKKKSVKEAPYITELEIKLDLADNKNIPLNSQITMSAISNYSLCNTLHLDFRQRLDNGKFNCKFIIDKNYLIDGSPSLPMFLQFETFDSYCCIYQLAISNAEVLAADGIMIPLKGDLFKKKQCVTINFINKAFEIDEETQIICKISMPRSFFNDSGKYILDNIAVSIIEDYQGEESRLSGKIIPGVYDVICYTQKKTDQEIDINNNTIGEKSIIGYLKNVEIEEKEENIIDIIAQEITE